jgi:hypothetical protein
VIVLATDSPVTAAEFKLRIADGAGGIVKVPGFAAFAKDLYSGRIDTAGVPTLTDSHAPTDSLIHVN